MKIRLHSLWIVLFFLFSGPAWSQDRPKGPPPARVAVSEVTVGMVAPYTEFIGTVYYQEVSEVASEVVGIVEAVKFEAGMRVKTGQLLVKLRSDLLMKDIDSKKASHEQILMDLEIAKADLKRTEKLYKKKTISGSAYDKDRYGVKGLEKKAESMLAEVERLKLELQKKKITAPFQGVVVERHVDRGEWIGAGTTVATIAGVDLLDIIVNVPERVIGFIKPGMWATIRALDKVAYGNVFAVIPKGDIATRTFPVRIRAENTLRLVEGMEARVSLPTGKQQVSLMVPRDAVLPMRGQSVLFAVIESKARMIPVKTIGYEGTSVGVEAEDLKKGMKIVIKGNERLRNGQPVVY